MAATYPMASTSLGANSRFDRQLSRILDHATAIFCEKGYEGASIRDLSRASGLSLAGLYYYFQSKDELLYLIQKYLFTSVMERLKENLKTESDPEKRLRIFISNHLAYFLARPKAMKVLSHEDDVLKGALGAEIRTLKRQYYHCCADLVEELKLAKKLKFKSRAVVLCLFGMMNWIHTWYNRRVDGDAATVAREIGNVFLRGIYASTNGR
jgi:TetR/AcrR family transcriptional regulator, cholesterol catabolism regulator